MNGGGGATLGAERFHALDAVRGGALILGVFFHATMSFFPGPQFWVVMDASRSTELSALFFVLHIFRMTVFFLLAGFFARLLLEKRGLGGFILNRATRIAAPLALFWPLSLTAIIAVAIWAAVQANGGVAPDGPPPPPMTAQTFPLTHLWFLYMLIFFYAGALVLRGVAALLDRGGGLRARVLDPVVRWIGGPFAPFVLAVPVACIFYLSPQWYSWFGIPTPDTGLIPNATALLCYGLAFGFGWVLHRQPDLFQSWARVWPLYALLALGATIGCLMIVGPLPVWAPAEHTPRTAAYAALYAFSTWGWTVAMIGFAVRYLAGESRARRYLADASYWIYLVHLPLVMVLQTLAAPYDWPWFVKFPLILVVAFAIMLASYQWFVRYSWIGAILNGKRKKPARADKRAAPEALAAAE